MTGSEFEQKMWKLAIEKAEAESRKAKAEADLAELMLQFAKDHAATMELSKVKVGSS